jgi:hypothetical protein
VRLSPFGTSATVWPVVQPRIMTSVKHSVEWEPAGETEVLGENLPHRHFVHHKSHMTWARTRAAAVGSRQLTVWAMARPHCSLSITNWWKGHRDCSPVLDRWCACLVTSKKQGLRVAQTKNLVKFFGRMERLLSRSRPSGYGSGSGFPPSVFCCVPSIHLWPAFCNQRPVRSYRISLVLEECGGVEGVPFAGQKPCE